MFKHVMIVLHFSSGIHQRKHTATLFSCSGGYAIPSSLWTASTSAPGLWTAQLPSNTTYFRQLFLGESRAYLARTPVMVGLLCTCLFLLKCLCALTLSACIAQHYVSVNSTSLTFAPGQLPSVTPHNFGDTHLVMYEVCARCPVCVRISA